MPSASSKSVKLASTEAVDPIKQAIVIVGHKIRNLEKRKSRLDSYKESIKSLTKEQIEAISKYDEVIQQLELSKEYVKQFMVISVKNDKLRKKQAKKEIQEKYLSEINKIKQVLLIQDVLNNMHIDSVRDDFLAGRNKAIQLTQDDLKILDDLHKEVSKKCNSEDNELSSDDQFQKAAECFMAIIDSKAKEMVGSTNTKIRELITSIHSCGYFDQSQTPEANSSPQATENEVACEGEGFLNKQEILSNVIVPSQIPSEANLAPIPNSVPAQAIVPGPVLPGGQPSVVPTQQQIIVPNVPNIVPTPVSQVESNFFNKQGFKPLAPPIPAPPNQNPRQINDVIQSVAGKFNFLQESELDLSEMNPPIPGVPVNAPATAPQIPGAPPSNIPTQTFTNQNFSGQPSGAPSFPSSYPPQPAAFQTFVPTFPAFVPPGASTVQNNTPNTNGSNPTVIAPSNPPVTMPTSNSNNKPNNIPNPMALAPSRNPNISFNQGQQQISSSYPNQPNVQTMPQAPSQHVFQHGNITVGSVENASNDTVRKESEVKEKQEKEKRDWSQSESTNWADDCVDSSEWSSQNPSHSDGASNENKFSIGRINRPGARVPRNTNGYQGNRHRSNRQGGYRESQNIPGNGTNYYQNQNGHQSRTDRNNEFQDVRNKGNSNMRDNPYKERGDFSNRDREIQNNYGGGFKRGPSNRGLNPKGPMDRGDRQGQTPRNNPGGPRGQRNVNRQPGGRNGPSFQRLQPNPVEKATGK